jgi:hypothetical protein
MTARLAIVAFLAIAGGAVAELIADLLEVLL